MQNRIVDLCGGTGAWSAPWLKAGYRVHNITLPDYDVTKCFRDEKRLHFFKNTKNTENGIERGIDIPIDEIYGILAAPPCTMFSLARTTAKTPRDFNEGMECVSACMRIIWHVLANSNLNFWALENPATGYLKRFMGGIPILIFQPWEFGDPFVKKTAIWGYFRLPKRKPLKFNREDRTVFSYPSRRKRNLCNFPSIDTLGASGSPERSKTMPGFAAAFFESNRRKEK